MFMIRAKRDKKKLRRGNCSFCYLLSIEIFALKISELKSTFFRLL